MAAETIKEFLVGLGFKVDQAGLSRFASGIASASAKAMALGAAITAAAGAIVAGVKNIAEGYDELDRLAETYRTTASEIDAFIDTAQILGVSNDAAKDSLKALDAAIVDTSMDMGRAKKVFEELGIEVKTADGKLKSTTAVMGELVAKLDKVERGKRVRVLERLGLDPGTMRVFGKDFAGFNADLQQVAADLEAIDKSVGFDFDSAVKGSKEFMLSWRAMGHEIEKWKMLFSKAMTSVAMKLLPQFREQLHSITENLLELRRRTMEHMPRIIESITPMARAIMRVAEAFIRIVGRVAQAAIAIINWFLKLNAATDGWIGWILAAAAAWRYLNLAFLATPLGALLALGVAIAALVDDFLTWKEGGESLIDWSGDLGDAMQALIDVVLFFGDAIIIGISKARDWLAAFFAWMFDTWGATQQKAGELVQYVAGMWGAVQAAWATAMQALGAILQGAWATIIAGWQIVAGAVQSAVQSACAAIVAAWQAVQDWLSGFFAWLAEKFPSAAEKCRAAVDIIAEAGDTLVSAWESVKSWFSGLFDFLSGGFEKVAGWADKIGGAWQNAKGMFGGAWQNVKGMFGGGISAPAPATQAALAGGAQTLNQKTTITVQGAGDPQATARAVAGAQNRVNADMARNMRGAVK